jgi:hypothetical protein
VQPGQRVMFQHGSLHEVVDQEKEPCGCPAPPHPGSNEFPLAQSAGLAPLPPPAPAPAENKGGGSGLTEPLVYKSPDHPAPAVTIASPEPSVSANVPSTPVVPKEKKKSGFFGRVGHFFRRLFGGD